MILVTGGLGFIGSHTARALLDLGESCLLVQRRPAALPAAFEREADKHVFAEQVDISDREKFLEIGTRHPVTGIVHLAGSAPWPPGAHEPVDGARRAVDSLLNVIQAARDWGVQRVSIASTIGVYEGVEADGPLREDLPLRMTANHAIPAFKKIGELLTDHLAEAASVEIVNMRISAVWGPLGRPASTFFPAPQLVHAAVRRIAPDLSALHAPTYAENGSDLCYAKDCGRAIALLHRAEKLNYRTYNIGSGQATTNGQLAAAIRAVIPDARIDLPDGRDPRGPAHDACLDISRISQDTGYQPTYNVERAVADYIGWLRAGNPR
jgi:UDP-glucose 4-epimerase